MLAGKKSPARDSNCFKNQNIWKGQGDGKSTELKINFLGNSHCHIMWFIDNWTWQLILNINLFLALLNETLPDLISTVIYAISRLYYNILYFIKYSMKM